MRFCYNHLKILRHLITLSGLLLSQTHGSDFELKETAYNHIASEEVRIYLTFVLLIAKFIVGDQCTKFLFQKQLKDSYF